MMNKKGATMTTVFVSIAIVMALFFGLFEYVDYNYGSANITVPADYYGSSTNITQAQNDLEADIDAIKDAAAGISQADAGISFVAWNGLIGIGATIKLFLGVIDIGIVVFNALFPALVFLPTWTKILVEMILVIWVVLIVIGAFKGESKT